VRARYKALASAAHIFSCNVCQLVREQRNTVKLPEHPEANGTASTLKSVACTTVKVVGMVKIHWAGTIGSQALMATIYVAYECSSQTKWQWANTLMCVGLRYSRSPPRGGLMGG